MLTRIVVADQSEARFYHTLGAGRPLLEAGSMANPTARLHERELGTDRPGRMFRHVSASSKRRGASPRYSLGGEHTRHQRTADLFARNIGIELEHARRAGRFERLVFVAAPAFLGRLRTALPASLRPFVVATVAKDIVHRDPAQLRRYLAPVIFRSGTGFQPAKRALDRSTS